MSKLCFLLFQVWIFRFVVIPFENDEVQYIVIGNVKYLNVNLIEKRVALLLL